jgi:hypothetical protein
MSPPTSLAPAQVRLRPKRRAYNGTLSVHPRPNGIRLLELMRARDPYRLRPALTAPLAPYDATPRRLMR